jgi:hypothetical protein
MARRMTLVTGCGNSQMLTPRSPWSSAFQKLRYCCQTGTSRPNTLV